MMIEPRTLDANGKVCPNIASIRELVKTVAVAFAAKGGDWPQESVVLHEVRRKLGLPDKSLAENLDIEQACLDVWHDLFTSGYLSWGWSLDMPGRPVYHVARR